MKTRSDIEVNKNAIISDGEGVVRFNGGLVLSDESEQVNGTRYDHSTTDLSEFDGLAFADHGDQLGYSVNKIVGKWFGVAKQGGKLVAEGIRFAVNENPLAKMTHDLVLGGFLDSVSIGTYGPEPDANGVYKNHVLSEVSWVGIGNNRNAKIGKNAMQVALNSLDEAEREGMAVEPLRKLFANDVSESKKGTSMADDTKKQDELQAQVDAEKARADEAEAKAKEAEEKLAAEAEAKVEEKKEDEVETPVNAASIAEIVKNALAPVQDELKAVKKNAFDKGATEPAFVINTGNGDMKVNSREEAETQFGKLGQWELAGVQYINSIKAVRENDQDAAKTVKAINEMNLERLKKEGMVPNTLTLGDFGNFVTSPELMTEIVGYRTDYSEALRAFTYQNTNSRDFSFLTRSGDIDLDDVDGLDDNVGTDTLKPVKEYSGSVTTSRLQEMAAVTPISTTANLFSAADLIQDATRGYRTAADKRFAQLPIARLEQAVEADGVTRSYSFDVTGSDTNAVKVDNIRKGIFSISQGDGVLVMTEASHGYLWSLLTQLGAANALGTTIVGQNPVQTLWGKRVVTVPNDLMPTLDDNTTYRSIPEVRPLAGGAPVTVTVNHAIFYLPLSTWKGRTNGNLRFDISADASYEVNGTVYSAFQRNEVVLRGAIFRGGAILDPSRVRGIRAENIIS